MNDIKDIFEKFEKDENKEHNRIAKSDVVNKGVIMDYYMTIELDVWNELKSSIQKEFDGLKFHLETDFCNELIKQFNIESVPSNITTFVELCNYINSKLEDKLKEKDKEILNLMKLCKIGSKKDKGEKR